jgi:hypothetical protein
MTKRFDKNPKKGARTEATFDGETYSERDGLGEDNGSVTNWTTAASERKRTTSDKRYTTPGGDETAVPSVALHQLRPAGRGRCTNSDIQLSDLLQYTSTKVTDYIHASQSYRERLYQAVDLSNSPFEWYRHHSKSPLAVPITMHPAQGWPSGKL